MTWQIQFQLKGGFSSAEVLCNGKEIQLAFNGADTWKRKIAEMPMTGPLTLELRAWGPTGTKWQFSMVKDGRAVLGVSGETSDDYLSKRWEIPIL